MSITPPAVSVWWNEPVEKTEVMWITIALVWALVMFFMMPYWHIAGNQNLNNEAYRTTPAAFSAKVDAMIEKYKVREEGAGKVPVVHPPAGGDVYLEASTFQWRPVLELELNQSYRFHMMSTDNMHGFSLLPENINIQIHPDYEMVITVKPTSSGQFSVICNEYCGLGHHTMSGRIYVVEK